MIFSTRRLSFRRFVPADVDQLYQTIYAHPAVAKALSPTGSLSLEQTADLLQRRLQHWQQHGFGAWALIHQADQQLIGHCGLHYFYPVPDQAAEVELTYAMNPSFWGQGLATEAATTVLQWGFETLKLPKIAAVTAPANFASQRVMQKLGMTYEKTLPYNGSAVVYYTIAHSAFSRSNRL
ncbi:MAG: GNAT family N-acetyltransferase [Leptolyngbyaceae cyanobacterium RM1_405_57]|nr:GNAT family N-acetyltransferase [Leptolyngbyaceae cyanobacterium RM1_405_57]